MVGYKAKCRVALLILFSLWVGFAALYGLLQPITNGCIMTYMYPTYVPIPTPPNVSSEKYGLFLYHEGWKKIDFSEHLKKLNGVPVLFIPGNGGSYKQVRSLGAESDRAYQGGPLELTFYQEASLAPDEAGRIEEFEDLDGFIPPNQYTGMLDWFAVDLEGEHSAMDGRILEEHTEYVVYAIHRILDQYQESANARLKEGDESSGILPKSVILVGHSMGGFVARAAIVHPHIRKSAVETVITLSSPHQSPPVALQPSLGHFYSQVNREWLNGYGFKSSDYGHGVSNPSLSHVIVVSVSGGIHDYQVRSKLASLDGIVPPTHSFTVGSTSMKNVWLSMEHQAILWCNQLVVQLSHTLLSLIDPDTGRPFERPQKRLVVLSKMLRSGLPQSFNWMKQLQPDEGSVLVSKDKSSAAGSQSQSFSHCPPSIHWAEDSLEKDLYIQGTTVTVLAMDGRRRWMDIKKLGSDGKEHFVFVTNLAPCSGVRIHLWPEKGKKPSEGVPVSRKVLEVTKKMVQLPAGPSPRQIEPGSQTEQPPPSAVLRLGPKDMKGFRFLTISVAPRPAISGRPPPAASMAVGQFFNPEEGKRDFSLWSLLSSSYVKEEFLMREDHPLALNLTFSASLGLLPVTLSLTTVGCGIKSSGLPVEQAGDMEQSSLCKLRCFPPVVLAWDSTSGLHVVPNLQSATIVVDSSPAFWGSTKDSDKTTVVLLVDPHCSYKTTVSVSGTSAASRFLLLYCSEIIGMTIAVTFFALMRQARAWELDLPLPSMLAALESNLRMPLPFLLVAVLPLFLSLILSLLRQQPLPPFASFTIISIICFAFANGCALVLILISRLVLHIAATMHVVVKLRWQAWEGKFCFTFLRQFFNLLSVIMSFKVFRILRGNPYLVIVALSVCLVSFIHPAVGLIVLLLSHAATCHTTLSSYVQRKEAYNSKSKGDVSRLSRSKSVEAFSPLLPLDENGSNSPNSTRSFGDSQLEIFNYRHGLLTLHVFAVLMFVPSLVAWLQRIGMGQSFPPLIDSVLCIGVILHGVCGWKPGFRTLKFSLPGALEQEYGLSFIYLLAGYYCYLSALDLAPYRSFNAMAVVGALSLAFRIMEKRNGEIGDAYFKNGRKHSHKH
ncbi:GPI inositol-deacylase isoform X2 [Aristolochia californica]|uniref:GPI inositol-deacylase isoform X2 n=1 Tax=Aristolochia californica TaxID=171875 RepID=UPI0035DC76FC